MIRLVLCLIACANVSWATTDGWPALYDVAKVASDDVLNIRSEPDSTSTIIGSFAHNATGIEVMRPNNSETWGLVAIGEGMGWVSLSFLSRQPGQWDGTYPEFTACYGTEPFWRLSRDEGVIRFEGMDAPRRSEPIAREASSLSHRGRHSFIAGDMVGVLSNRQCSDGMSEREYGWELNLILRGQPPASTHYTGCCSIRPRAE